MRAFSIALGLLLFGELLISEAQAGLATYSGTLEITWSEVTHPGAFTFAAPHFSLVGGAVHSSAVSFWQAGTFASAGIERMAEDGGVSLMLNEVNAAITAGTALAEIRGDSQNDKVFSPTISTDNTYSFQFTASEIYPLLTLATMVGPTPDWFVGVSGLSLFNGNWKDNIVIELFAYDAGTEEGTGFSLNNLPSNPIEVIHLIPNNFVVPINQNPLGTLRLNLVSVLVPEPSSLTLLGIGCVAIFGYRWRKRFGRPSPRESHTQATG